MRAIFYILFLVYCVGSGYTITKLGAEIGGHYGNPTVGTVISAVSIVLFNIFLSSQIFRNEEN